MLRCERCGSIALGFASKGDECFGKRCKGLLVLVGEVLVPANEAPVEVSEVPRPQLIVTDYPVEESHNGYCPEADLEVLEAVEAPPEHEEVAEGDDPLSYRQRAVQMARQVLEERGKAPDRATIDAIRALFRDLGSIHRPARGYPDMARAREQHKGQFFTSTRVGELMWDLIDPPDGLRVLESAIGSANLIPYPDRCFVTGIDVDRDAVIVSRAVLGPGHCVIADELQHHSFREEFEIVVGNPPYSVSVRDRAKLWGRSVGWDGWGRAEVVWLEQAALAVKRPGVVAAILPVGMYEVLTPRFVKWLESKMHLVAEVVLPRKEAHVFSEWPVSLYVWVAGAASERATLNLECHTLDGWLETPDAVKLKGRLNSLLLTARTLWAKAEYEGPLVITPYQKPKERRSELDLPLVEEDVVLIRMVNGRMRLQPNGMGALARMELLRLEMGERYDRKQERHISHWNELWQGPPILRIGQVIQKLWLYGLRVEVDRSTKAWLKRRSRWWKRQQVKIPRWVVRS